jgi:CRP/FNR family cyclic AMP-dependent transcriptional regulator
VSISPDAWTEIIAAGVRHRYQPGDVLLRQGEPPTHVLALLNGRVKASRTSCGGEVLVLAVRGPGEILGDISVLGGGDRSATITAADPCDTRLITADRFLPLVRSLGLEAELFRHAMSRIRESEEWRAELATLPAGPRLAWTLLRLAVPGPPGPLDVCLNQEELGQAAGLSRSTVAAELAHLRAAGAVVTARRRVLIADLQALQSVAVCGRRSV